MKKTVAKFPLNPWEKIYQNGREINRAPFDEVVSFVYKFKPEKANQLTRIFEVGCGVGNNILWLAQQGFRVWGTDSSPKAIELAQKAFKERRVLNEGLFCVPFHEIDFDMQFDMVVDRAALSCCPTRELIIALDKIHKSLIPGGKFLFTPYAAAQDNIYHYDLYEIDSLLDSEKWKRLDTKITTISNAYNSEVYHHRHFTIVLEKK